MAELSVTIDSSGARQGANDVINALTGIQTSASNVDTFLRDFGIKAQSSFASIAAGMSNLSSVSSQMQVAVTTLGEKFAAENTLLKENYELKLKDAEASKVAQVASSGWGSSISTVITLMGTLAATIGVERLSKSFIETSASFESFETRLQTLTGHGQQTFNELVQWAMKMPVSTKQAVDSYTLLQAMGIDPTIKKMQTLLDATMAIGKGSDGMQHISLAMGEIASMGELSARQVNMLAFAGINARQYLEEAFGTSNTEKIKKMGVSIQDILKVLWDGMQNQFGGTAVKMADTWNGVTDRMVDHWDMVKMAIMDKGPFDYLKSYIGAVIDKIDEMKQSGQLDVWAKTMADSVVDAFKIMAEAAKLFIQAIAGVRMAFGYAASKYYGAQEQNYQDLYKQQQDKLNYKGLAGFAEWSNEKLGYADRPGEEAQLSTYKSLLDEAKISKSAADEMFKDNNQQYMVIESAFDDLKKRASAKTSDKENNKNYFYSIANTPGYETGETERKPYKTDESSAGGRGNSSALREAQRSAEEYARALSSVEDKYSELTQSEKDNKLFDASKWYNEQKAVLGDNQTLNATYQAMIQKINDDANAKRIAAEEATTAKINKLTLSEHDYKVWALNDEVEKMKKQAQEAGATSPEDQTAIATYQKESLAKIEQEYADKRLSINADLTQKLNQLTMTEHDYKLWSLDDEIEKMREKAKSSGAGDPETMGKITRYYDIQKKEIEKTGSWMISFSQRTSDAMEKTFSDYFFNAMTGQFKNFEDVARSTFQSVARMVSDYLGQALKQLAFGNNGTSGFIGNWLSNMFGASSMGSGATALSTGAIANASGVVYGMHSGGVVGQDYTFTRNVPMSLFSGASRFHDGLYPDEFPAILQKGELVIPKNAAQTSAGKQTSAPNVSVNVHNSSGTPVTATKQDVRWNGQEMVVNLWMDAVARNVNGVRDFMGK